nr:binding partner of ACD11 1-like isoform X3 [Coffea arabica]
MDHTNQNPGENTQITSNPNWTINVPDQIRTIKVSNISPSATDKEIQEFFSFSGNIQYVEMQRETETTQLAYVTFEESKGADTAMLLTEPTSTGSAVQKAEDVVSTMLSKGFSLGKDALNKAKSFDEKHQLTSTASATVASIDTKLGLTEKLSQGTAAVNEKVKEMDERFQVSEKTRSAFAAAEQRATVAGSAIMSNRYVSSGASWVSNAFNRVAKAAEGVSIMTKEKVAKAEEERRDNLQKEQVAMVNEFAHVHLDQSLVGDVPAHPASSPDGSKLV